MTLKRAGIVVHHSKVKKVARDTEALLAYYAHHKVIGETVVKCTLCKRNATYLLVPLCEEHNEEIDKLLEEVRLELLAEAELDQRNPAKVEAVGPTPTSETGEGAYIALEDRLVGRTAGSEPVNVGSTPTLPT